MKDGGLNGHLNGLPVWAKAIAVIGFPAFVALFLLAQSAGVIPSEIKQLVELSKQHNEQVMLHVMRTDDLARSVRIAAKIMCQNSANDERQLRACDTIP